MVETNIDLLLGRRVNFGVWKKSFKSYNFFLETIKSIWVNFGNINRDN